MRQETFCVLQDLAERHTGQFLHEAKGRLFASRLNGLAFRTGHDTIDELARYLGDYRPGSNLELEVATALLDLRSRFMPEHGELQALFDTVIAPALAGTARGRYRIWCAGCGFGQEAYSLRMMLDNRLAGEMAARVDIVGTDISDAAIARASKGLFGHFEVQIGLSARNLLKYFTRQSERDWQIAADMTRRVPFQVHNLLSEDAAPGRFDLILCRHVLGGMTPANRDRAQRNLERHLHPGGHIHLIA